jgi:hypothetical protein
MGVGSVGKHLRSYTDSDTFLSTDAGLNWRMVQRNAHLYEFGDQGSIIVIVDDEETTDKVRYSLDAGKTWYVYGHPLIISIFNLSSKGGFEARYPGPRENAHNHS